MTEQNKKLIQLLERTGTVDKAVLQEKLKKAYYEGQPIITDAEYDELFGDNDYVGYTPDQSGPWQVLEHKIAMGSLEKLKTWEQAVNWLKDKGPVLWQPKLDGLSIEIVYEYGIPTHSILRGGGDKGEDVLKNAINFKNVPSQIASQFLPYVSVRGEVVIRQSDFDSIKSMVGGTDYKNRRNCIPGICRRYDGQYSDKLSFYAYDIIEDGDLGRKEYKTELDKLRALHDYGFTLPFTLQDMNEAQYNQYGDIRDTAENFQMDGLVIKTMDMKHQIALKFEPKGEQTTVTGYAWEIGSTGKYVPKILFNTVNVGGSNLSQAAVGSYQGYLDLNATIGSTVEVRKMGDVIPKVTRVLSRPDGITLETPTHCPHCGSELQRVGADLFCLNKECIIKQIDKCCFPYHAVKLKGVRETWIKELMKQGKVKKCYDVPTVKPEDIAQIDGYSMNTAIKIMDHLKSEYTKMMHNGDIKWFLCMLPIPDIGGKALDKLAGVFTPNSGEEPFSQLEIFLGKPFDNENLAVLQKHLGNSKGTKAYDYLKENKEDILQLLNVLKQIAY